MLLSHPSQLGEGTHPVHSNISCLSRGSAVCPSLELGRVLLGRVSQCEAARGCGIWSQQLLIQREE